MNTTLLNNFTELQDLKDVVKARNGFCLALRKYPSKPDELKLALAHIKENLPDIIETHDKKSFLPKSEWSKAYHSALIIDLASNFSEIRFQHILNVGSYVYSFKTRAQRRLRTVIFLVVLSIGAYCLGYLGAKTVRYLYFYMGYWSFVLIVLGLMVALLLFKAKRRRHY